MKSLFEEMGGTYRQEGDYLIPNLALPEEPEYQIGKYGHLSLIHILINIGILAHVDAGKTTLTESLLYASGAISEPGSCLLYTSRCV